MNTSNTALYDYLQMTVSYTTQYEIKKTPKLQEDLTSAAK